MKTPSRRQTEKKLEASELQTQDKAGLKRLNSMVPGERNEPAITSETHAQDASNRQE